MSGRNPCSSKASAEVNENEPARNVLHGVEVFDDVLEALDGVERPVLGEQVDVMPNHVCATVNLVDEFIVGNKVWHVAARGCNA